jgi:hypothetical protein
MPSYKYRELLARLKPHGVAEYKNLGEGSERLWIREDTPGSGRGPQYSVKCHGENTEVKQGTMKAILRRFNLALKDITD